MAAASQKLAKCRKCQSGSANASAKAQASLLALLTQHSTRAHPPPLFLAYIFGVEAPAGASNHVIISHQVLVPHLMGLLDWIG